MGRQQITTYLIRVPISRPVNVFNILQFVSFENVIICRYQMIVGGSYLYSYKVSCLGNLLQSGYLRFIGV